MAEDRGSKSRKKREKERKGEKQMNKEEKIAERPIKIACHASPGQPPTHSQNQSSLHM